MPEDAPAPQPPGTPGGLADPRSRTGRRLDAITMATGLLCAAGGLTVVAAVPRATAILRIGGQNSMTFNIACCLAVTGIALIALARGRPRAALAAGAVDALLGTLTAAEWALGRGLGIDQLVVRAFSAGQVPCREGRRWTPRYA